MADSRAIWLSMQNVSRLSTAPRDPNSPRHATLGIHPRLKLTFNWTVFLEPITLSVSNQAKMRDLKRTLIAIVSIK
jgi:hypothetical protein